MDKKNSPAQFGNAIRQRRKALGKTLQEVAAETELTTGFISQVERGISSPSLSSFMRIAASLQTSVEELLSVPETYQEFLPSNQRHTYSIGEAGRHYEKLGPGFPGALFYPCIIHRPSGHVSEKMMHTGESFCYLISGSLEYHIEGRTHIMKPGDCIHHNTNVMHYSKVISDEGSVELWVSSRPMS